MAEWGIEVGGLSELRQRLQRVEVPKVLAGAMQPRLQEAVAYARNTYLTGGTTSTRLAVRSGALRNAFGAEVTRGQDEVTGRIGYIIPQPTTAGSDPLVYARVHEGWPDGRSSTTIRPRRAQYLAIPLPRGGAGLEGLFGVELVGSAFKNPRDFPNTFVQRSRQGNLLIFQKTGKDTIVPLFVLRKEVVIPARPALRPTMQRFLPLLRQDLLAAVLRALQGASS